MSICGVTIKQPPSHSISFSGEKKVSTTASSANFDQDIKPIFEKHCNPCHFPGGKMYERLPFDQALTIIKNEQGILRRIKDTDEVKIIREFVEENSPSETNNAK